MKMLANKVANGNSGGETVPANHANGSVGSNLNHHETNGKVTRHASVTTFASESTTERKLDGLSTTTGRSSLSRVKILVGRCVDDPRTPRGRRNQMMKILGMAAVPIVILIIQSAVSVSEAIREQTASNNFIADVEFAIQAGAVVHALGLERGTTTFYVSMQNDTLLNPVYERRRLVDKALSQMSRWPTNIRPDDQFYQTKQDLILQVMINRVFVNTSTPEDQLDFFTDTIGGLLNWIADSVIRSQSKTQRWQELVAYQLFITAKEAFAAERSCGTVYYARGNMSQYLYLWYHDKLAQGRVFLNRSMQYNPYIRTTLQQRWYGSSLQQNITYERKLIDDNDLGRKDMARGLFWYAQMTAYQGILYDIETNLTANITANLNQAVTAAGQIVGVQLFVVVLSIVLFPSIIFLLTHITGQIQRFASILQQKNEEVMKEKKRTEAVLNHLLPRQIAEKIKLGQPIYPESYDQVTVFFSDIVQFTEYSSTSTPLQVVDTLNKLYTIMDKRIEAYDVYKVETIGDAYLCVSGLPERNGNKHSFEIASMSLDLVKDVSCIRMPHKPDYELRLRIGLNTGPCVAGITGLKMPRYCIFGDTVNTASRMESNGEPLRIHLSTATYDALTFFNIFVMERRGEIQIKGKGLMITYWLLSKKETKRKLFGPEVSG